MLTGLAQLAGGAGVPAGVNANGLAAALASVTGMAGGGAGDGYKAQNDQAGKLQFNNAGQAMQDNYLKASRNAALSPYEVKAGWDIPAVLDQGVNSDLPGEMHAVVRENVYDTGTGRYLLIPKGSRVLGYYNSNLSFGQERVQVVWHRIIFPDASSINLGTMVGQDASGYAGFHDQVNNHWGRIIGGAVLVSVLGGLPDLATPARQHRQGPVLGGHRRRRRGNASQPGRRPPDRSEPGHSANFGNSTWLPV
jgi:type IV secretion system protein VirB10